MGSKVDVSIGSALIKNAVIEAELELHHPTDLKISIGSRDEANSGSNVLDSGEADRSVKAQLHRIGVRDISENVLPYVECIRAENEVIISILFAIIMLAIDDYIVICESLKKRQRLKDRYLNLVKKADIEWFFYNGFICNYLLHKPADLLSGVREFTQPFLMDTYVWREKVVFSDWLRDDLHKPDEGEIEAAVEYIVDGESKG